jgi:hypothetical protein
MDRLTELIKAIRNRCDIYLLIQDSTEIKHAIPTLLEDMHEDSQAIMDEYCVERIDD